MNFRYREKGGRKNEIHIGNIIHCGVVAVVCNGDRLCGSVGGLVPWRNCVGVDKPFCGISLERREDEKILEANAKTKKNGKIAVATTFFGSSVDAVGEIVAVAEDIVEKIVRRNHAAEDMGTARMSYYESLAEIFEGMARKEREE